MAQPPHLLIVDDQSAVREELVYALEFEGYRCAQAEDGPSALTLLDQDAEIAAVLLDVKMPGIDGLEVLKRIREKRSDLPVLMISGHADIETAVVALRNGAFDFLQKPFDSDRVLVSVKNALRVASLETENASLRDELAEEYRILGESPRIEELRRILDRAAPSEAQVLITGENGTGKELVARQIHARSRRRRGPFVPVNCAAIPGELIESELFGHERGAFTGAHTARKGCFELAHGGTLFLDEVGDMAADAQAKLLRALQDQVITRIGGQKSIQVDVRVVAATNQDLTKGVEEGSFREDLFYRLRVVPIHVPALRERASDAPMLAQHFLHEACKRNGTEPRILAADAQEWLRRSPWPGNVRELRNLCEAVTILTEGHTFTAKDFQSVAHTSTRPRDGDFFALPTLEEFREGTEREFIRRKLEENAGNVKRTAERIGIQRSNLYKKLDRYGLK